tara:strand:+ start:86 stop:637 length:552 start_codon:yes stop_codon:yes gene_type:complete
MRIPLAIILGLLTSISSAQDPVELRVVEVGSDDVSPLSNGLKIQPLGLSIGNGFDQVYQTVGGTGPFFRSSGNLFAVFDRSVYKTWGDRFIPEVPPGTVFHIGPPAFLDESEFGSNVRAVDEEVVGPIRSNVHLLVENNPQLRYVDEISDVPTMPRFQTDPGYRGARLRMLVAEHLRLHPVSD